MKGAHYPDHEQCRGTRECIAWAQNGSSTDPAQRQVNYKHGNTCSAYTPDDMCVGKRRRPVQGMLARVRPQTSSGASLEQAGGATPNPFTHADRIGMLSTPTIRTPPPHLAGGSSKGISV